jgi:hypothetical protein
MGHDRQAFFGRGVDGGNIPHTGQRHIQGARDGRCGQCEHIHRSAQLFEMFLVGHPKALLFIDHHQTQVFE